jgi:membrane protease YdiL (CAAX protease family)
VSSADLAGAPPSVRAEWLAIALGLIASWGWLGFAQFVGSTVSDPSIPTMVLFYLLVFAPLVPIALAAGRIARISVLRGGARRLAWTAGGFAIGLAGFAATVLLSRLNGGLVTGTMPRAEMGALLVSVVLIAFQTGAEEVTFRGWLQPVLVRRLGAGWGIALAAVLFVVFHVVGGGREPVALVSIGLAGALFGLIAWRSGGLLGGWAAHFAWNTTEDTWLGLTPNPGNSPFGSFMDLDLAGSPLWGGGPEGLNASIGTAAVLLALIVPLALPLRRDEVAAAEGSAPANAPA